MTTAASHSDSVIFRWKDRDSFRALYDWLVSVVEHNRSAGIDSSRVAYEVAEPSRLQRAQEKQSELKTREAAGLVGEDRPDIVTAIARMGWKLGGKRELKKLAEHLHPGEMVHFIAQGTYERDQGVVVLTDQRLLFLFHGVMSQRQEDFPLRLITSVQTKAGLMSGELKVFLPGNTAVISGVVKGDLEPLANALRQGIAATHASPTTAPATHPAIPASSRPPAEDPYEQLAKLAKLRDAGVLTEEEFAAKKHELLARM